MRIESGDSQDSLCFSLQGAVVTQTETIYANICIYNSLDFIQLWNLRICHTWHLISVQSAGHTLICV